MVYKDVVDTLGNFQTDKSKKQTKCALKKKEELKIKRYIKEISTYGYAYILNKNIVIKLVEMGYVYDGEMVTPKNGK